MSEFDYLKIAKWIVIVLLAGFVGQFGKSLAKHLMERARMKKERLAVITGKTKHTPVRGYARNVSETHEPDQVNDKAIVTEEEAKQRKKEAKALAKQKKKEAKALEKQGNL